MYPQLRQYIIEVEKVASGIPESRQQILAQIANAIQTQLSTHQESQLIFICTHNSRRSHFGQVWAAIAAYYYGIGGIKTYSGGTEATAFNPRAVAALINAGLQIQSSAGNNPNYALSFANDAPALTCFSKRYNDPPNPQEDFIALMTCDEADEGCPVVLGAEYRFAIHYRDPKEADDTPEEKNRYGERCLQIASEMFYLFSLLKK